ncbi:MAG: M20/M25/M40 family metallo-hydrolase [Sphingomonadales bacterium]|nr:M20/M25/M40 family metallo-hydrolase [Sphingomonadales bacterium]
MSIKQTITKLNIIKITFTLLLMLQFIVSPVQAQELENLSADELLILSKVDEMMAEQVQFLETVVNINSGTMNTAGVRAVGQEFRQKFDEIGFETSWVEMPTEMNRAGHLVARHSGYTGSGFQMMQNTDRDEVRSGEQRDVTSFQKESSKVLLLGHLDTVFPVDSEFQKFELDGHMAKGPGIADMKAGNVVILYALKALSDAGLLDDASIDVMFTGDEESAGSPFSLSRGPMVDLAKENDVVLSFESGRVNDAVIARRGSSNWSLEVTGKRAHSAGIFRDAIGAGAIFEASRILNAFYEEVRGEEYLTFNPGIILGGTNVEADFEHSTGTAFGKTNVVAQTVKVSGGLRFLSEEQKTRARARMREIVAKNLPQTSAEITFEDRYPAMSPTEGNMQVFEILRKINADLNYLPLSPVDPGQRGAGDISFVAPYISGIDALGPSGRFGHTIYEELDMRTIEPMTKRAALLIYRLINQQD